MQLFPQRERGKKYHPGHRSDFSPAGGNKESIPGVMRFVAARPFSLRFGVEKGVLRILFSRDAFTSLILHLPLRRIVLV